MPSAESDSLRASGSSPDIKPRSRDVTDGLEKAAARGMLRAVGMGDDDFAKPQIGVAVVLERDHPVQPVAGPAGQGASRTACTRPAATRWSSAPSRSPTASRWATRACTSRWSPARSSPTRVETVMQAERLDGSVLLAGCDKSLPGMLMAAARLDLAVGVPLRRLDPARLGQAVRRHRDGRHDHRRLRGGRRLRARADDPRGRRRASSARSAPARAPAAACTPPTPWPAPPRRWACRCPAAPRRRRPTAAATGTPGAAARPSSSCCAAASPPATS